MNKDIENKHESDLTKKERYYLEIKKIKSLSGKKKIEYLWSYYRFVLAILFVILLIGISIGTMYKNSQRNTLMSIVIVDANQEKFEEVEELKRNILESIGNRGKHDEVVIDISASSSDDSAATIKTIISISSMGENDIVICNEETYKKFKAQGAFANWVDVLGEDYSKYEKYIYNDEFDLSLSDKWLKSEITSYSPVYACVLSKASNKENIKNVIEYFFN
ncbi:MAG: hypothetical protein E6248_05675 [Clostridium sp.]|uniref:hypothetical protein n=1 Tax=Clostridium sp. TaxID=1506 RepID=UPI00290E4312|nr:hypothetical protein [Clostridium sp.]MDU5109914.1 hypothetical protein [Clostridium sp.]